MTNWPDPISLMWMIIGLAPIAAVILQCLKYGRTRLVSLFTVGIGLLWLSYHLTPWLAIATDGWSGVLLQPEYIGEAVRFSTLSMYAYGVGYALRAWLGRSRWKGSQRLSATSVCPAHPAPPTVFQRRLSAHVPWNRSVRSSHPARVGAWQLPEIPLAPLVLVAVAVVALQTFLVGGIEELLWSSRGRGEGQFDARETREQKLRQAGTVLLGIGATGGALLGAVAAVSFVNRARYLNAISCFFVVAACNVPAMSHFSRGSGFVFIFWSLVFLIFSTKGKYLAAVGLFSFGIWFSWTGFTQRGSFNPGLANFLVALGSASPTEQAPSSVGGSFDPGLNPLNAVDAWTAAVWAGLPLIPPSLGQRLAIFAEVLQPLPSEFAGLRTKVGAELAEVFGTWGSTGITTPALAELYLLFGESGVIALFFFGLLARAADEKLWLRASWVWGLVYIAIVFAFVMQLHSGIRAATRVLLYVGAVALIRIVLQVVRRPTQRSGTPIPGTGSSLDRPVATRHVR
jgi:hypothetical protein